jgi:cysteine sulfinate desulfinase/cysteine desulfurase-like protein
VLGAMFDGAARARSSVRFSLGETTTRDEIERALAAFRRVVARTPKAT